MPDPTPAVVPTPDPTPAPVPDKPAVTEPFKAYATQEDYEAHKAKMIEADKKRADRAEAELAALKTKNESEAEKVERERQEKSDALLAAKTEEIEKRADLRAVLMSRGLDKDKAGNLAELAGGEWADTDEAIATLEGRYGLTLQDEGTTKIGGGGGRNAPTETVDYSAEGVQKKLDTMNPQQRQAWLEENGTKIREHREKVQGILPSIAPGQGLSYRDAGK